MPTSPSHFGPDHRSPGNGGGPPRRAASGQGDRDRVLAATDIAGFIGEHVTLRRKGAEFVGLCPFHDDHSPSMAVVVHKGDGFYKCFACGAAGNAIDFAMKHLRLDFREALELLARRAGIALAPVRTAGRQESGMDRAALLEANAEALRHWRRLLASARGAASSGGRSAGAAGARQVADRGIADAMVEAFQLGVAAAGWDDLAEHVRSRGLDPRPFLSAGLFKPRREGGGHYDAFRNRVIFPIFDEAGRPIAFGGRKIDPEDEPKYLNSAESPLFRKSRTLYGLHLARKPIIDADTAVVTEGYTDVIACHQHGFSNVVATLGTALTVEHAQVLRRLCSRVVLLFDGDEAGQKAADRAAEVFFAEPVDVLVSVLPDGRDPDELLRLEGGAERFRSALDAAVPVLDFLVARFRRDWDATDGLSLRQQRLEAFLERLAELGLARASTIRRELVLRQLAELTSLSLGMLQRVLEQTGARIWTRSGSRSSPQTIGAPGHIDGPGESADSASSSRTEPEPGAGAESRGRASESPPPRAVVAAEEFLLGLLVRFPDLAQSPIDVEDGHFLPVVEAYPAVSFQFEPHRLVATALFGLLENAASADAEHERWPDASERAAPNRSEHGVEPVPAPTLQTPSRGRPVAGGGAESVAGPGGPGRPGMPGMATLLSEVARDDLRLLASDLFLNAERRTGGKLDQARTLLRDACTSLDSVRRRFDLQQEIVEHGPRSPAHAAALVELARHRGHDPSAIALLKRR